MTIKYRSSKNGKVGTIMQRKGKNCFPACSRKKKKIMEAPTI